METNLEINNIFFIPVGEYFGKNTDACYIVYAPLKNKFFLATPGFVQDLKEQATQKQQGGILSQLMSDPDSELDQEVSTDTFCTLHLLLNEKCNFHCKYCYSAEGRSSAELTIHQIEKVLNYFLSHERKSVKDRTILFIGGGEPMLSWPLLEQATIMARDIADREKVNVHFSLTTNGSILKDRQISFLKTNGFTIQISFEVLPDVQRKQRGPYASVAANIQKLTENGINCFIRSTITEDNVDLIPEMVDFCNEHFPMVKKLSCQQVVDSDYFNSTAVVDDFFHRYFLSYQEGVRRADAYGIALQSSSSHLLNYSRRVRFCFNLLCLTPFGTFTLCPDVSSPNEPDYRNYVIGELKDDKVLFDQDAFEKWSNMNIHTIDKCRKCYARWNCGSGCPSSRRVYSPEIFDAICDYYRKMLCNSLMEELARKHKAATGNDFFTDMASKL